MPFPTVQIQPELFGLGTAQVSFRPAPLIPDPWSHPDWVPSKGDFFPQHYPWIISQHVLFVSWLERMWLWFWQKGSLIALPRWQTERQSSEHLRCLLNTFWWEINCLLSRVSLGARVVCRAAAEALCPGPGPFPTKPWIIASSWRSSWSRSPSRKGEHLPPTTKCASSS